MESMDTLNGGKISNTIWFLLYVIIMIVYISIMGYVLISGNKLLITLLYVLASLLVLISFIVFWIEMKVKKLFFTVLLMAISTVLMFELFKYAIQLGTITSDNVIMYYGTYALQCIVLVGSTYSMYKTMYSL
jgi:hypothetical protein